MYAFTIQFYGWYHSFQQNNNQKCDFLGAFLNTVEGGNAGSEGSIVTCAESREKNDTFFINVPGQRLESSSIGPFLGMHPK